MITFCCIVFEPRRTPSFVMTWLYRLDWGYETSSRKYRVRNRLPKLVQTIAPSIQVRGRRFISPVSPPSMKNEQMLSCTSSLSLFGRGRIFALPSEPQNIVLRIRPSDSKWVSNISFDTQIACVTPPCRSLLCPTPNAPSANKWSWDLRYSLKLLSSPLTQISTYETWPNAS